MARNKKRKVVTVMEEKKKGFIKKFVNEFKAFALKGNVMDLAVGVIHILEFNSATALVIRYFHSIGFYICIELYSLIISLDSCQR